jgi:hypothetical protein
MKRKHTSRINAIAFAIMVKALLDGEYTAQELAETTGLAVGTVRGYVNAMHRAGAVYVSGWEQDDCGRYRARQYTLGEGQDKPRPKPAPQKQKSARWRAKIRNIELINRMAA